MSDRVPLYTLTPSGVLACRVCHGLGYQHARDCPIVTLRWQLRELTAALGLFVASMRETVETVDMLLRGPDAAPEEKSS
jgi:hypothetical protein